MLDEEIRGLPELAAFLLLAIGLDLAELLDRVLELAGDAGGVEAEPGDLIDGVLGCERGVGEDGVFELGDAVESPRGVGEKLDHGGFGGGGRFVFFEESRAELLVRGFFFGWYDDGFSSEAMSQRVERRTLLSGFCAGAGGVLGVGAVNRGAIEMNGCCCGHMEGSFV